MTPPAPMGAPPLTSYLTVVYRLIALPAKYWFWLPVFVRPYSMLNVSEMVQNRHAVTADH